MDNTFDPLDEPMDDAETAPYLGIEPSTLPTWRAQGKGPQYLKLGKKVRYTPRLIQQYLMEQVRTPISAKVRADRRRALSETA